MDKMLFYYATERLTSELRYSRDVRPSEIDQSFQKEKKTFRWVEAASTAASTAASLFLDLDSNVNDPVYWSLGHLEPEEIDQLERDWKELRQDFPVAGLKFQWGAPWIFCAKLGDFLFDDEDALSSFYSTQHDHFMDFLGEHRRAISQMAVGHEVLCLGFTDPESFEIAKRYLEAGGGRRTHPFRQATCHLWLCHLPSFEVTVPRGFSGFVKGAEKLGRTARQWAGGPDEDEKLESRLRKAELGPCLLEDYCHRVAEGVAEGRIEIPSEWLRQLADEEIRWQQGRTTALLRRILRAIIEARGSLGRALFSWKESTDAEARLESDDGLMVQRSRIAALVGEEHRRRHERERLLELRIDWTRTEKRIFELSAEKSEQEAELGLAYGTLAAILFEEHRPWIAEDAGARRVFGEMLEVQEGIDRRQEEIEALGRKSGGFWSALGAGAKKLYHKGIIFEQQLEMEGLWEKTGEEVYSQEIPLPESSEVADCRQEIAACSEQLAGLSSALEDEQKARAAIEAEVASMIDSGEELFHPWHEVESFLDHRIETLTAESEDAFQELASIYLRRRRLDDHLETDDRVADLELVIARLRLLSVLAEVLIRRLSSADLLVRSEEPFVSEATKEATTEIGLPMRSLVTY